MKGRTRNKKYSDYGISEGEEKDLLQICRGPDFKDRMTLLACAELTNEGIASELYYSIVKNASYEKLDTVRHIPISKPDFYGYRRKCLAVYKDVKIYIPEEEPPEMPKNESRKATEQPKAMKGQMRCDIIGGQLVLFDT